MSPRISTALIFAIIASIAPVASARQNAAKPGSAIVVDEENDGLPGESTAPSRKAIEDLIRTIGREPVSPELVDRIDALFRPRCASPPALDYVPGWAGNPAYIARLDAVVRELTKTPADTRTLVENLKIAPWRDDDALRADVKDDLAREAATRKTIKGRVVDDDSGKPIAGAVVLSGAGMMTRTDAHGDYVLKTRAPDRLEPFLVTIEAPGHALTSTALDWKVMAEPEVRDFRLLPEKTFGGRVVDPEGKPIVGAEAMLSLWPDALCRDGSLTRLKARSIYGLRVRTDQDGRYAFRNVPPESGQQQVADRLYFSHPKYQGRVKFYARNELLGDAWEVALEPGNTVRGVVLDEAGKPVADLPVAVQYDVKARPQAVLTDAQGRFRFDNLPMVDVRLDMRPRSHVAKSVTGKAEPGEPAEIKITLSQGEYFEGKVVEDDKPVAGAQVSFSPVDRNLVGAATRSRDDGTFRVGPVAKGHYTLRAMIAGRQPMVLGGVEADSGAKGLVIKLGPPPLRTK